MQINLGTALHELLHALGLSHKHSYADRDQFMAINMAGIERGKRYFKAKVCFCNASGPIFMLKYSRMTEP